MLMFNTIKEAQLRAFWGGLEPIRVLAKEWGCSDAYISLLAKKLGLPSRKNKMVEIRRENANKKFQGRIGAKIYFDQEAARRGLTPAALEQWLIGIISQDHLVCAIIDDGMPPLQQSQQRQTLTG
jgi:hypothetical protein